MNQNKTSKNRKLHIGWLSIILMALLFQGCASESRIRMLDNTLKVYADTIRWGRYEDAAALVRNKPNFDNKTLSNIKVTSYKERQREVDEDAKVAKTVVEIRYYNKDVGKEQIVVDKQEWTYFEEPDSWLLTSDMLDLK